MEKRKNKFIILKKNIFNYLLCFVSFSEFPKYMLLNRQIALNIKDFVKEKVNKL